MQSTMDKIIWSMQLNYDDKSGLAIANTIYSTKNKKLNLLSFF